MPYQIQRIIEGKSLPVCVSRDDTVGEALSLMIEHDFSQLPVTRKSGEPVDRAIPEGMITYEGILRAARNFRTGIDSLRVRDVLVDAPVYSQDHDLFDILDRLKETNVVLVTEDIGAGPQLVGIVTSYDTTEYFRERTEDLMRVEDIELMVKDFIKAAYTDENGQLDQARLDAAILQISPRKKAEGQNDRVRSFDELTLNEFITLLILKETWGFFEPIFGLERSAVNQLLQGVREIRNALAHFRGEFSVQQRDQLKFAMDWLARCQEEYQARLERQKNEKILALFDKKSGPVKSSSVREGAPGYSAQPAPPASELALAESDAGGRGYDALAEWLQDQPGGGKPVQLTFDQIEQIIDGKLPPSARKYRAWWANDSVGHSHSQLWLEAGWRTTYVNMSAGRVTFSRIQERERAYIDFFSRLLAELRRQADFPIREASPDGASWIYIQTVPNPAGTFGFFMFSFSRDKRFRVELYLDLLDKDQTKAVFNLLFSQREQLEAQLGLLAWEPLEHKRASRIAAYHAGQLSEEAGQAELRSWATKTMIEFYNTLATPARRAILQVRDI